MNDVLPMLALILLAVTIGLCLRVRALTRRRWALEDAAWRPVLPPRPLGFDVVTSTACTAGTAYLLDGRTLVHALDLARDGEWPPPPVAHPWDAVDADVIGADLRREAARMRLEEEMRLGYVVRGLAHRPSSIVKVTGL